MIGLSDWCVSSAVIFTLLTCMSVWRFMRGEEHSAGAAPGLALAAVDRAG